MQGVDCQRKVEMSPSRQSRNVPLCLGLSGVRVNLRLPVKRRRCVKKAQRRHAVRKMKGGPSESPCRGRFVLSSLVTADTLLAWHRKLIAQKYDGTTKRGPGRPRSINEIDNLVVRIRLNRYNKFFVPAQ